MVWWKSYRRTLFDKFKPSSGPLPEQLILNLSEVKESRISIVHWVVESVASHYDPEKIPWSYEPPLEDK
jgi:hypothetical protein